MLGRIWDALVRKQRVATAWDSMVAAASEERVDDTNFEFSLELQNGDSYEDLSGEILRHGVLHPDLGELIQIISKRFNICQGNALTAIDRALGGVVRAATQDSKTSPDEIMDPVGAAAFCIALRDHSILDAIFPGWRQWRPGSHS